MNTHSNAAASTVTEVLQDDHRRLDALAAGVVHSLENREPVSTTALRAFITGLRRHIRVEEDTLFPRFEAATGMHNGGPTFVMRSEHREIESLLASIEANAPKSDAIVDAADAKRLLDMFVQLEGILGEHNHKEERVLYPMADRTLAASERAAVVAAMAVG
jgi:iron-sulfur cluster repair protein YtfE (RIC family)